MEGWTNEWIKEKPFSKRVGILRANIIFPKLYTNTQCSPASHLLSWPLIGSTFP